MNRPAPGLRFGINVAVTVLVTLAIGIGAYGGMLRAFHPLAAVQPATSPTPSTPSAASPSPVQPVPNPNPPPEGKARLAVLDFDLLDASNGWVLLTNCNAAVSVKCQYLVAASSDGGGTWTRPVQVGPAFDPTDGSAPRHVRVAGRLDSFVYGFSGAFATHDGGKTWKSAGLPAHFVYSIAIGGHTVWAVTQPCPKGAFCQFEVRSSADGGRTWSAPHTLPQNFDPLDAVAFDSGVVMGTIPVTGMQITSDGGATWHAITTHCTGYPAGEYIATSDGNELWELCYASGGRTLFVSEDGGKSWSPRATPHPVGSTPSAGVPAWFVSNRPQTAFMSGVPQPYVTRDGGVTWNPATADQLQLVSMRFAGPTAGWALDSAMNLWVTTDGGDDWSEADTPPSEISQ